MIAIKKVTDGALQAQLDDAKNTNRESVYREGPVYAQIKEDFHGKCYLCEDDEATSINIEHFEPHKGNLEKKYDWENLFYSCGHCNNLKGDRFWPLLNCTNPNDQVWECIELRFIPFPKADVEIIAHPSDGKEEKCKNTVDLLRKTIGGKGTTRMKRDEANALRRKILRVYKDMAERIADSDEAGIKKSVADSAPFAGLQRWTLKNEHPDLFEKIFGTSD